MKPSMSAAIDPKLSEKGETMITLDVAEYCSACMDFDPDVQRPQKAYGLDEEIVITDTVIRCANRNRCKNIERYLRKKVTDDGAGKNNEAMP